MITITDVDIDITGERQKFQITAVRSLFYIDTTAPSTDLPDDIREALRSWLDNK